MEVHVGHGHTAARAERATRNRISSVPPAPLAAAPPHAAIARHVVPVITLNSHFFNRLKNRKLFYLHLFLLFIRSQLLIFVICFLSEELFTFTVGYVFW